MITLPPYRRLRKLQTAQAKLQIALPPYRRLRKTMLQEYD